MLNAPAAFSAAIFRFKSSVVGAGAARFSAAFFASSLRVAPGATEDEPLRAQRDAAVGYFFIQSRGGKMRRGIIAVGGNENMDAKERKTGARDAAAGRLGVT